MAIPVVDKVPASTLILAAPFKLMAPLKVLVPEILLMAPKPLIPVPIILTGSAVVKLPWICKAAPL